ncbi:MAG: 2-C-methyl-D-erythritol 4-phosphate cytidylyltransferase [Muribaculaceae bacterium]|nr:2-C-methyl-D-erythritol 4-phosphate cytidylyltransferase [Muribaculaceae bacterium]
MKAIVIIAAGGVGRRFGAPVPKQFCKLQGREGLLHAIERFRRALPDATIAVVIDPSWRHLLPAGVIAADPGQTRWQSVANALKATAGNDADAILAHDGARPLVTPEVINGVVGALAEHQGAIPVVAVTDSLRRTDGSPADRSQFRAVQTPQAFRADLLRRAYELPYSESFTDDASVMTAAGFTDIALTPGDPCNIKITNPLDLQIAEVILNNRR